MTCYVWLNFFYYIQIVPAQQALFMWGKGNSRSVIYMAIPLDGLLFLFNSTINIASEFRGFTYLNGTDHEYSADEPYFLSKISFFIIGVHILVCLCIMTVSSFSTAFYLRRHMRNMAERSSGFYAPKAQSQMRFTITGISQEVLYFLFDTFHFLYSFTYAFSSNFSFSYDVTLMVTSLYISGTTINLGVSQAVFRQRAGDIWRALKRLWGIGRVSNDVNLHIR